MVIETYLVYLNMRYIHTTIISVIDYVTDAPVIRVCWPNYVYVTYIVLDNNGRRRVVYGTIAHEHISYVREEVDNGSYHKTFCLAWNPADERRLAKYY